MVEGVLQRHPRDSDHPVRRTVEPQDEKDGRRHRHGSDAERRDGGVSRSRRTTSCDSLLRCVGGNQVRPNVPARALPKVQTNVMDAIVMARTVTASYRIMDRQRLLCC